MRSVMLLLLIAGVACPLVVGYHVDPIRANWSGRTGHQAPNNRVSEVITVNFDEPITASLFCGSPGAGGSYHVGIYTYPGGVNPLAISVWVSDGQRSECDLTSGKRVVESNCE